MCLCCTRVSNSSAHSWSQVLVVSLRSSALPKVSSQIGFWSSAPEAACHDVVKPLNVFHRTTAYMLNSSQQNPDMYWISLSFHSLARTCTWQSMCCKTNPHAIIGLLTRANVPSWGKGLATAGMLFYAGNHLGMSCTIGQSQPESVASRPPLHSMSAKNLMASRRYR